MIDTARHYIPIELLLQQIEAMEMAKYNVFHWHITDAQSFPFESHLFPNLTLGAYSGLQIYTHDDVKYVIDFAKDRGIRVIPEFDLPGHCSSWNAGYPGFAITFVFDNQSIMIVVMMMMMMMMMIVMIMMINDDWRSSDDVV